MNSMSFSFHADTIHVTSSNVSRVGRGYPAAMRRALSFAALIECGALDVHLPNGEHLRFQGRRAGPQAVMIVDDMAFAQDLARNGEIGVAEAYLKGYWRSPDLTSFLELFCVNQPVMQRLLEDKPLVRWAQQIRHWLNRNTRAGSKRNIHAHYDLGNDFYAAWLDESMTYSSALYADETQSLPQAQREKYRALAESLDLRPEHRVLEIGCGWGGFAEFAAREIGCRVTALTISRAQWEFARARIAAAGLSDRVDVELRDYRDEQGIYDRIVSIEMFEAVGEAYWPAYFHQLRDRLAPSGKAGLQVITIDPSLFERYRREGDFIRRYIFPGGMLPTPGHMRAQGAQFGLTLSFERAFGRDYARTVMEWRDRFRAAWPRLEAMGFDERFRRLWIYYLCYCEAGFNAGTIDVRHMVFAKA